MRTPGLKQNIDSFSFIDYNTDIKKNADASQGLTLTNVCILRFSLPEKRILIMEGTKYLLSRRKKLINNSDIPHHAIESIARCILPDILAYYESEEGQKEFVKWKKDHLKERQVENK